jgi:hypothetical protein
VSKDKNQVTLHIVVNKNAPVVSMPVSQIQQQQKQNKNLNTNINNNMNTNNTNTNTRAPSLPIEILQPIYFNTTNQTNNDNNNSNENNIETPQNSPTQQEIEDWGANIHFHGCFFNEEEAQQVAVVFDKKKGIKKSFFLILFSNFIFVSFFLVKKRLRQFNGIHRCSYVFASLLEMVRIQ